MMEIDGDLQHSNNFLSDIKRTMTKNKFILCLVLLIILIAVGIIIYIIAK